MEILKSDINSLINLVKMVDKDYGKGDIETYHYIKKTRAIIDRFNFKYPEIQLALKKTNINISLRIFLRKDSTKKVFTDFNEEKSSLKDRIFNNKTDIDMGVIPILDKTYTYPLENTLALRKDSNRNMVEILYTEDGFSNVNSPEFKTLAMSALQAYNKEIKIKTDNDDIFCFDFDSNADEEDDLLYTQKKNSDEIVY